MLDLGLMAKLPPRLYRPNRRCGYVRWNIRKRVSKLFSPTMLVLATNQLPIGIAVIGAKVERIDAPNASTDYGIR